MATGTIRRNLPTVVVDNSTFSGAGMMGEVSKTYTVSGNGVVIAYVASYSDATSDSGTFQAEISLNDVLIFGCGNRVSTANDNKFGQTASCPIAVSNGDEIKLMVRATKNGNENIFRRFLCFGCTVTWG